MRLDDANFCIGLKAKIETITPKLTAIECLQLKWHHQKNKIKLKKMGASRNCVHTSTVMALSMSLRYDGITEKKKTV